MKTILVLRSLTWRMHALITISDNPDDIIRLWPCHMFTFNRKQSMRKWGILHNREAGPVGLVIDILRVWISGLKKIWTHCYISIWDHIYCNSYLRFQKTNYEGQVREESRSIKLFLIIKQEICLYKTKAINQFRYITPGMLIHHQNNDLKDDNKKPKNVYFPPAIN